MKLLQALNWRYATKRMTGATISDEELSNILESVRLAPTAYGLQPFTVVVVNEKEKLKEIYEKACPQIVLMQCSHLLIFKTNKKILEENLEDYVAEMKRVRNTSETYNENYRMKIRNLIANPEINNFDWATRQTYIALGYATVAAALQGVDSTPIEGFNAKALNDVLDIDTEKEEAVVMLTLGYRNEEEDKTVNLPKIRKPLEQMVEWT